ncbi:MAG: glycosyltransferase family 4 protein [Phycisphaerales bacterium JB065]
MVELMRILHISTRLILGGSQEHVVLLCEGQTELGHSVHLAYGPIYGPEGSMLERVTSWRSSTERVICHHEVPDLVRELSPVRDRRCLKQLTALIRELKPDIVHTHSSKAGILGRMAAWKAGGREGKLGVVHTVHGPPFHRYEKKWRNAVYIAAERMAAKRCHAIASVCDAMTEQFLEAGIGRREQYVTVRSGMETGAYLEPISDGERARGRDALGLGAEDLVIGTVSRISDLKGHGELVEACAPLMRERPEVKLLWVGDGWLRGAMETRLDELGLRDRVVMTGMVPPQKVPGLMKLMDVLVHPSSREGLPRAVVQGMLSGLAVIATDVDGTPEVCMDGQTGLLVKPGDPEGLRGALERLIGDEGLRQQLGERGRAHCRVAYGAQRMVDEMEAVYARVLEGLRGR